MSKRDVPNTLSVAGLRELYREGRIAPADVVAAILERSAADAGMNIWIAPPDWETIRPYVERLAALDPARAPLWGVPFAIKDNIDLAGVPTTAACPAYAYTPEEHASAVARLIDAGAIPVGKTNMDQFATGLVGARSPFGETHNALRPELISGGSSSGSAVAVARGQAAFALGTDTAGSGRVPAALNRLVGFKPSLGAWPTRGVVPACASLDCASVFAHSMEDALAVDRVVRGFDAADPWSRRVPHPYPQLPCAICLPQETPAFYGPYAEAYRLAWEASVRRWEQSGVPLRYIDGGLFAEAAALLYEGPWVAERWAALGGFVDAHPGALFPATERVLRSGTAAEHDAASVFRAMHRLQVLKLEARRLLEDAVLAMPTCGGTWAREQVRRDPIGANREMGRYTNHCNLLDLCAVSVPADDAAPDVPFGVTLFALAGQEGLLCGAAEAFAQRTAAFAASVPSRDPLAPSMPDTTLVAVCGLHMRGYPLERQMRECRARFVREAMTAPRYRMVKLPTVPAKPGLVKQPTGDGGGAIRVELWEMPLAAFGAFVAAIPAPLGIGKVELDDGTEVPGFVCEAFAAADAEDVTASGGWRNVK